MDETVQAEAVTAGSYAFRKSILEKEQRFAIDGDVLSISAEGAAPERIPFQDVVDVHLRFTRTKQRDYYACRVKLRSGREIYLQNMHYRGFADFENRHETYTPFVLALHQALVPYENQIRFHAGSILSFGAALVVMGGLAVLLLVMLLMMQWVAVLICAFLLWRLYPIPRKSKPMRYRLEAPPKRYLPQPSA